MKVVKGTRVEEVTPETLQEEKRVYHESTLLDNKSVERKLKKLSLKGRKSAPTRSSKRTKADTIAALKELLDNVTEEESDSDDDADPLF